MSEVGIAGYLFLLLFERLTASPMIAIVVSVAAFVLAHGGGALACVRRPGRGVPR